MGLYKFGGMIALIVGSMFFLFNEFTAGAIMWLSICYLMHNDLKEAKKK